MGAGRSASTSCLLGDTELTLVAAFERAVYSSKSFIIALALCRGRLTADQAADAAHVEVRSQIEQWGEVEDSESGRSLRQKSNADLIGGFQLTMSSIKTYASL